MRQIITEKRKGMTDKEAIKYLKQLYPNGGHCWLDEQRVEAIGMAIRALQKEPVSEKKCMFTKDNYTDEDRKVLCADCDEKCEYSKKEEPVSEDLEEAAISYAATGEFLDNGKEMIDFQLLKAFKAGAQWKFEHQWINVKDRLPIEEFDDGYTFVFVNISVDEDTCRFETDYIRNGKWELHPNENITHWMPIPPIPNKED